MESFGMAASPKCPLCGYRALRFRKRTKDFVCRKCNAVHADVIQANEPSSAGSAASIRRSASRRRSRTLAERRELEQLLTEFEQAAQDVNAAAREIFDRHDPWGRLPKLLSLLTGVIVAVFVARVWRWYWAALLSLCSVALSWFLLTGVRTWTWIHEHPLLVSLLRAGHWGLRAVDRYAETIDVSKEIVQKYLPVEQSRPLLDRLHVAEDAVEQALRRSDDDESDVAS
jgi:ribosomal protein L37AE/L43A